MDASIDDMEGVKEGWSFLDLLYGPLPTEVTIVKSGDTIRYDTMQIGSESWSIWSDSGHSIEHLCLQNASRDILF